MAILDFIFTASSFIYNSFLSFVTALQQPVSVHWLSSVLDLLSDTFSNTFGNSLFLTLWDSLDVSNMSVLELFGISIVVLLSFKFLKFIWDALPLL